MARKEDEEPYAGRKEGWWEGRKDGVKDGRNGESRRVGRFCTIRTV
jgi:hypothetical protein